MLDFTTAGTIELSHAIQAERKVQRDSRKWFRVLRDLRREEQGYIATPRRRRELRRNFISALDEAHAAGMTIDAYMQRGSRVIAEPLAAEDSGLSERAEWAGLNDRS